MSILKIIKTEADYDAAIARLEELLDGPMNAETSNELEILSLIINKYEEEHYPSELPDPIDALKFRMEQEGLTRKDLVKYIGSQSKVSEVLSGKRSLSLRMIRALHEGLGISAEVLLQEAGKNLPLCKYDIADYPFNEMYKCNYLDNSPPTLRLAKEKSEEYLMAFFKDSEELDFKIACRQNQKGCCQENTLKVWQIQAAKLAKQNNTIRAFEKSLLDAKFIKRLVRLSYFDQGPSLVKEALNKVGIHFVILSHLPKTHLDGACFFVDNNPVITLTLRHDRLDNFWFTLMHELGHIIKGHITPQAKIAILDDTDVKAEGKEENAADTFAKNSFISATNWNKMLPKLKTSQNIVDKAEELEISPAIIAGRIRNETKCYSRYSDLLGHHEVKKHFEN